MSVSNGVKKWVQETSQAAAWAPILVFAIHIVLSQGFNAYQKFPPLDIPMHFIGGVAIAYFFYHMNRIAGKVSLFGSLNALGLFVLTFAFAATSTIFWEFTEFLTDRYLGTRAQVSLNDTLLDMFLGLFGAVTMLAVFWMRHSAKEIAMEPAAATQG